MSDELLSRAAKRIAIPGTPSVTEDGDLIGDLAARVRELEAERDALRRDAERYRWQLEHRDYLDHWIDDDAYPTAESIARVIDAAIDQARKP